MESDGSPRPTLSQVVRTLCEIAGGEVNFYRSYRPKDQTAQVVVYRQEEPPPLPWEDAGSDEYAPPTITHQATVLQVPSPQPLDHPASATSRSRVEQCERTVRALIAEHRPEPPKYWENRLRWWDLRETYGLSGGARFLS